MAHRTTARKPDARTAEGALDVESARGAALQWVNAPLQDRSRRTLERLLDATETIIRTRGVEAVTIPAVTRAARSSVGSFYARFADKTALLRTLHDRACDQSIATASVALDPARWRGVSTADQVRAFVGFLVMLFAERRPMMLAFSSTLRSDPASGVRRAQTAAAIGKLLRTLLLDEPFCPPRSHAIRHPHPPVAVDMSLRMVMATLEHRTALESTGSPEVAISDDLLAAELTRAVLRYLDVREDEATA